MIACVNVYLVLQVAAFASLASTNVSPDYRRLSYEKITGYEPGSDVTSHSRIDLDQAEMEAHLGASAGPDFAAAKDIYQRGGNSGGYADITVSALVAAAAKGSTVTQAGNSAARGTLKSAASSGATTVRVTYLTTCKGGGSSSKDLSGCFALAGGNLVVGGVDVGAPSAIQNKYRTLAGFSTAAQSKMAGQEFYAVYRAYYNTGDYANQRVIDALDGVGTCSTCDTVARVEIAKKTSAYMNVWMYVVREMEDAIMDCQSGCLDCNDDPVHAWDEAVAFYSGSLEGKDGSPSGKLLHELADKRCANFGTCGSSDVNAKILQLFQRGQSKLLQGKCVEAIPIKRRIVQLMSVPLVQGSLRYAYKVDKLSGGSKERAEGAAFSAAILPRIAACDATAAGTIGDNLRYAVSTPMAAGFTAVKEAFESSYDCLGITCEEVGGLVLDGDEYYESAAPCVPASGSWDSNSGSNSRSMNTGLVVGIVVVVVLAVAMGGAAVFFWLQKRKYQKLSEGKGAVAPPASTLGKV